MPEQDVEHYLRSVPASNRVRAAAWDAVYAPTDAERQQRLSRLALPDSVKADLLEMSRGNYDAVQHQPAAPQEPEPSQLSQYGSRTWELLNPMNIVHAVNQTVLPEAVGERFGYERSGPVNFVNEVVGNTASELAGAVREPQAAMSHLMNAVPIAGPVSRDVATDLEAGRYGRAAGTMTGVGTAALASPGGAQMARQLPTVARDSRAAIASRLEQGAQRRVTDVMSPKAGSNIGRRMGNTSERLAPQLARDLAADGAPLSRSGFHEDIRLRLRNAEEGLDAAADARVAASSMSTDDIIRGLEAERDRLTMRADVGSRLDMPVEPAAPIGRSPRSRPIGEDVTPGPNRARVAVIDQAIEELRQLGNTTTYEPLRRMRAAYDQQAKVVYNPSMTADFLSQKGGALGASDVTRVIRDALAKKDPATAAANAEYSLYRAADDVLSAAAEIERVRPRVGRAIMARLTFGLLGSQAGPAGAIAGYAGGPIIDSALASGVTTQLQTARTLQRLADAVRAGDMSRVNLLVDLLGRSAAASGPARMVPSHVPAVAPNQEVEPQRASEPPRR